MSKKKKSTVQKSIEEFDTYCKSFEEKEYVEINELYKHIKNFYVKKIQEDGNFNINIEKISLERKIGKCNGNVFSFGIALYVSVMAAILQVIITYSFDLNKKMNPIFKIWGVLLVAAYIVYLIYNEFRKQKPKDLMFYISLKVIEDIEKEINEKKSTKNLAIREMTRINDRRIFDNILKNTNKIKRFIGIR